MMIPGNIWTSKNANIETSLPVNLYLLKAYPAGIAITKPSRLVPIETMSEFLNQIQNDSPSSILLKCSPLNESPISPPSALPGETAISKIQIIGIKVMTTKWSRVICEPIFWCRFCRLKLRFSPYSIAETDNSLVAHTDTARLDNQSNDKMPGTTIHALIHTLNSEIGIKINR